MGCSQLGGFPHRKREFGDLYYIYFYDQIVTGRCGCKEPQMRDCKELQKQILLFFAKVRKIRSKIM